MNNTYNNIREGIQVTVNGTTISNIATSINNANIYGVTANVSSNGNLNIIYNVPGPFFIAETDTIDTPLANVGVIAGEYGQNSNYTIISGTISSGNIANGSYFGLGINWNSILNSVPQSQRKSLKEIWIAQQERQKVGTPSYRNLNVYIGSVSPAVGHPWTT